MRKPIKTMLLTASLVLLPGIGSAETELSENQVAYSNLFRWLDLVVSEGLTLFEVPMTVHAGRSSDVDVSTFSCTLDDGDTTHEFKVNEDGRLDLPHRPDWNESERVLTCNLSRQQAFIDYLPQARPLTTTRMRYRDLMEYVPQFTRYWKGMEEIFGGGLGRRVNGVVFFFGEGGGTVTIHAPWGDEVLESDERGGLEMDVDYVLIAENPEIELSSIPRALYGS